MSSGSGASKGRGTRSGAGAPHLPRGSAAVAIPAARITVDPGARVRSIEEEWDDALVVVESGEIELECRAGIRRRFPAGAIMWLQGMNLHAMHNPGAEPTVLSAVSNTQRLKR